MIESSVYAIPLDLIWNLTLTLNPHFISLVFIFKEETTHSPPKKATPPPKKNHSPQKIELTNPKKPYIQLKHKILE